MVIDRDDVNKVLQSMMKIMEDIFMGTMKRFIGSGESVANMASSEDGGKAHSTDVAGTTRVGATAQNINSGLLCQANKVKTHDQANSLSKNRPFDIIDLRVKFWPSVGV